MRGEPSTPGALIDSHTHVFSPSDRFAPDARYRPSHEADIVTLRALWQRHRITHGVLVQPSFYGTDNRRLLEALATDPVHLRGVVVVDTRVEASTLHAWHDLGIRGIRLNLIGRGGHADLGGADWLRVYRDIAPLGWHVEVQPEPGSLPSVLETLADCPAPIVVDHFGRPDPTLGWRCPGFDAMRSSAHRQALFVKLSGLYRSEPVEGTACARRLLDDLGPERLMWASDWPWTSFESRDFDFGGLIGEFERWVPDARAHRIIAWQTPARVFDFA